ncbi:MAG: glycosyltransferase [Candidatus Aminicenantes bacterium]|nr:glycosyltransferase [Candidatus Aminicenantes bacterium]NIN23308.1 glycosyltransferase [Candidatus Aminicenantes bacterium]NIN89934.1 glycosyltransferase [Candidatus Aminicenantes bacterium]NIO86539.1 glycosyltransferase [Candidatus Aminicenantes bacterium]
MMKVFFDEGEIGDIKQRLQNLAVRHVVYCSFENRFAKSGGLAAVTTRILPLFNALKDIQQVVLMTPFYPHIIAENKLEKTGKYAEMVYDKKKIKIEILKYTLKDKGDGKEDIHEYYLKAPGFFEVRNPINDPYLYHEYNQELNNNAIRENALFFSKAVPLAVKAIGLESDIVFHLQEWQTTLIALTAKIAMLSGDLTSCGTVQTMHNPFDSYILPEALGKIVDEKYFKRYLRFTKGKGHTAYQLGLQLVDAPITTVSDNFAKEFITDILQTQHFAPHLQDIFLKNGVWGVNNGMFKEFPPEFSSKDQYTLEEIKKIKLEKRKALLEILDRYNPPERFGQLTYKGKSITHLPRRIPLLVMSGRLDPNQKGFDILLQAVEQFTEDEIKVILTPMPVKASDLDYFYEVANKCKGNVTVFPIHMVEGFHELQTGSTFGIMPSIYEPFGAAVEYMVNGTVTIARQTGGLVNQIDSGECGFLFREDAEYYNLGNIRSFTAAADNIQRRKANPWAVNMTKHLYHTIKAAARLYREQPDVYYRFIRSGFQKARYFNWKTNAEAYMKIFRKVNSGF